MPSQTVVRMETSLVAETCWSCGMTWAMPWGWARKQSEKGNSFYCPRGCNLTYGESEIEKVQQQLASQIESTRFANRRLESEQNSHRATKGHLTRQKKRAAAGVCPCCNRTFNQLSRHMKSKHPNYAEKA